jgi:TetR/AcrR family transcriptional regulator, transcriptional repressor for nem operon
MGRQSTARTRLIESARELIHSSNYGSASVDDLCTAADVNKGSFYYFFPSKRDLALAALDAQWESAKAKVLEPSFAADVPPLERIARFFRRAAQAQRRPVVLGCPFGNLAVELSTVDEAIRDKVGDVFEGYRSYFTGAVKDAIAAGDIPPQDVTSASEALVAYFQGTLLLAKTRNDASLIERLGESALNLLGVKHG